MLTLNNINTFYGKIQALWNVSLHIEKGEIVTLVGANGAGKSTTLMSICGATHVASGEVLFDGKPITTWQQRQYDLESHGCVDWREGKEMAEDARKHNKNEIVTKQAVANAMAMFGA